MTAAQPDAKGFTCGTCGKFHEFPMYVFAHMRQVIVHDCDCGAKHSIVMATARQTKKGKVKKPDAKGRANL